LHLGLPVSPVSLDRMVTAYAIITLHIGTAMQKWYALDIGHMSQQLHTDLQIGLTEAEAQRRLQQYGANEFQGSGRLSPWAILLEQFKNIHSGIFTRPIISLMVVGGVWLALANLGLFVGAFSTDRSTSEAMAVTFIVVIAVVLLEFGKAYNFRSDRYPVFRRPFANKWLNLAIIWELLLLALVVYLLVLHASFSTYILPLIDWAIVLALALTIIPVLEIAKWVIRRQGRLDNGA
jgi:magnesium-transporting ATPase (P-type)